LIQWKTIVTNIPRFKIKASLNPRKGISNTLQGNPWAFRSKITVIKTTGTVHGRACKAHNRACLKTQKQQSVEWNRAWPCVAEHGSCVALDVVAHGC